MDKQQYSQVEIVIFDLMIYLHPDYLLPSFAGKLRKGKNYDKILAEKYWKILTTIQWFAKKLSQYEVYFKSFYPMSSDISPYDALDHHIHAYLEDMETLKNKLTNYVGHLKNDINKKAINKSEIDRAFKAMIENIKKVFGTSNLRGAHRHGDFRFVDEFVSRGQLAITMLSNQNLMNILTEEKLKQLEVEKNDSIDLGKKHWSKTAAHNCTQTNGLINEVVVRTSEYLYKLLDIESLGLLVKKK